MKYVPLVTQFKSKGWTFRQVQREKDFAIFHREGPVGTEPHLEVIIVGKQGPREQFGQVFPAKEVYPGDEKWGTEGWTYLNKESAERKMAMLLAGIRNIRHTPDHKHLDRMTIFFLNGKTEVVDNACPHPEFYPCAVPSKLDL